MNESEKDKEAKRKAWNKRKVEDNNKKKYGFFKSSISISKEENVKIYLDMIKEHARIINKRIPIRIANKCYIVYPDGKIYKNINLNDF